MDIKSLEIFCDLADELHFGSVAEKHNMSPSTLSRTVQRLESQVGESLFARDNRNVNLTAIGQIFFEYAKQSLADWQAFKTDIASQHEELTGSVSLYCSVTASHSLLSQVIARLRQRHSGIELKLHTGDQALSVSRVLSGQEDLAIAARPDKLDSRLAFKSLSISQLVLIAPLRESLVRQQLNQMHRNHCWDWSTLPWIVPERGLVRKRLNQWLKTLHVKPRIYAEVAGNEAIVSMVGLGLGVGVVPELVITNSPAFDSIEAIENGDSQRLTGQSFDIGLCVQKRRLQEPIIEAVWSAAV